MAGDFEDLAKLDEADLRDLLRFHREHGVTEPWQIEIRRRLDTALDRVALLELGVEIGVLSEESAGFAQLSHLKALLSSSAFVRYADNYLTLGIHFVAERLTIALPHPEGVLNELPVSRPCPPGVDAAICGSDAAMSEFLRVEPPQQTRHIAAALLFLDDFSLSAHASEGEESSAADEEPAAQAADLEQDRFELWVRGLADTTPQEDRLFQTIARGIVDWYATRRASFYDGLNVADPLWYSKRLTGRRRADSSRGTRSPLASACTTCIGSLAFFVPRCRRAVPSPTPLNRGWNFSAQRASALKLEVNESHRACEHVLRAALDYACDLVQNAVDIVSAHLEAVTSLDWPPRPASTWGWRRTFDEELDVIARQRRERLGVPDAARTTLTPNRGARSERLAHGCANADAMQTAAAQASAPVDEAQADGPVGGGRPRPDGPGNVGWSRRIKYGASMRQNSSDWPFRAAAFAAPRLALGVLQRLQELDVLRKVDYLSTVSGGGYIGSWLVGNVLRNRYWLTKPTDWEPSIRHLRRYSNYLSPRTGLLSADTWTMWGSWIWKYRAHSTGRGGLAVGVDGRGHARRTRLLLASRAPGSDTVFGDFFCSRYLAVLGAFVCVTLASLAWVVDRSLRVQRPSRTEGSVQREIVLPALIAALLSSAILWAERLPKTTTFSNVFLHEAREWWIPLVILFISFLWLSWRSIDGVSRPKGLRQTHGAGCRGRNCWHVSHRLHGDLGVQPLGISRGHRHRGVVRVRIRGIVHAFGAVSRRHADDWGARAGL